MLALDGLMEFVYSAWAGFTSPVSVNSKIFFFMRISSILTVMCILMAIFNDYHIIDCWDGTQLGMPPNNHQDRAKWNYLKAASTFCYMQGAFVVVNYSQIYQEKDLSAIYGLGNDTNDVAKTISYYQWVPLALGILALCLRLPELLWEINESGMTKCIINGLDTHLQEEDVEKRVEVSTKYFVKTLGSRQKYPILLIIFEIAAVMVSWGSIYVLDVFLDYGFIEKVSEAVFYMAQGLHSNYLRVIYEVFPRVAKCTFWTFGSSGTVQSRDFICVLSLNIIYEKIFLVIWVYLLLNAIFTSLLLLWHLLVFCCRCLRQRYLVVLSLINDDRMTEDSLRDVLVKTSLSDEIILMQLRSKMVYFSEWIRSLALKI